MFRNKKLLVISGIIAVITLSIAASRPPVPPEHKNLKVLPKNISHDELDKIMDGFKAALGVGCKYCHAAQKDNPRKTDFASDEKPEKNIARNMMRMTNKINKKYFHYAKSDANSVAPVNCMTCHHGEAHPEAKKESKK